MNSDLYKLLMTYGDLDPDFVYYAFDIMMEDEEELKPYIRDFKLVNYHKDYLGKYSNEARTIEIDTNNIINTQRHINNKKLLALQVIRHEMEHARSLKRLHEKKYDIETTILRYSLRDYALWHGLDRGRLYSEDKFGYPERKSRQIKNWDLDPGERIAEIKAWRYMVNLLKNQRRTEDLLTARSNLYYAYIRGYDSNGWYLKPPTYEFLLKMDMLEEYKYLKERVEDKQYIFDTRLMYGLPLIDGSEHDEKILQKVRLQKKGQSK